MTIELLLKIEEKYVKNNLLKFYDKEFISEFTKDDLVNTARNDLSAIINYNYCPCNIQVYKQTKDGNNE